MWEIYAYQNADSLFGIFNAAATIHGLRMHSASNDTWKRLAMPLRTCRSMRRFEIHCWP